MARNQKKKSSNAGIIWGVLVLLIVFFASFMIFRHMGTIEYEGLSFTKESTGAFIVYHYYYLYEDKDKQLVQNNIYLRGDPRDNDIPVEGGNITFLARKFTYVSINATALSACNQSSIAISELSSFLANGGLQVRGAILENESELRNTTRYSTCETDPYNTVIEINGGDVSKVSTDGLCTKVTFSSCADVLPAAEKFIVQSIIDAKEGQQNIRAKVSAAAATPSSSSASSK